MKNLSKVLTIAAVIVLIVAVIGRIVAHPISIIAPQLESRAMGELASILLLLAIAINTSK